MEHNNNLISVHFENSAFEGFLPGFAPDGCTVGRACPDEPWRAPVDTLETPGNLILKGLKSFTRIKILITML